MIYVSNVNITITADGKQAISEIQRVQSAYQRLTNFSVSPSGDFAGAANPFASGLFSGTQERYAKQGGLGQIPSMEFSSYTDIERQAAAQRKHNDTLKEGRMPMLFLGLSIMFAGMALQKAMTGLLQPAMDAVGIFDIISAILTILFLPAMLMLVPPLLDILKWVTDLTPEAKLFVGTAALVLLAIGSIAAVLGQFMTLEAGLVTAKAAIAGLKAALGADGLVGAVNKAKEALTLFMATPFGFVVGGAVLTLATLYVGSLIYKDWIKDNPNVSPEVKSAVSGGEALSQQYLGPLAPVGEMFFQTGGAELAILDWLLNTVGVDMWAKHGESLLIARLQQPPVSPAQTIISLMLTVRNNPNGTSSAVAEIGNQEKARVNAMISP